MPLPPNVQSTVRLRFQGLIAELEAFLVVMEDGERVKESAANVSEMITRRPAGGPVPRRDSLPKLPDAYLRGEQTFAELQTKILSLLSFLGAEQDAHLGQFAKQLGGFGWTKYSVDNMLGVLRGLLSDLDAGMLDRIAVRVEAELTADYLGQAERLLDEGRNSRDVADRVPAAVLTGAVLENALKLLCQRRTPPIPTVKPDGTHKMLNTLIDEVKGAGVYNELQAKELRGYADIRNAAAHGEFDRFDRAQVERMVAGVQGFLAKHM